MMLVDYGGKAVAEDGATVYRLVCLERLEGKHQVQLPLLQTVHQFLHGLVLDVELHVGIGMKEGD